MRSPAGAVCRRRTYSASRCWKATKVLASCASSASVRSALPSRNRDSLPDVAVATSAGAKPNISAAVWTGSGALYCATRSAPPASTTESTGAWARSRIAGSIAWRGGRSWGQLLRPETAEPDASRLDDVAERLQVHALVGASHAFLLDEWDVEQRGLLLKWLAHAGQRLRERVLMNVEEARQRYRVGDEATELRGDDP